MAEAPAPAVRLWQLWQQGEQPDLAAFLAAARLEPLELAAVLRVDQRQRWLGERKPAERYLEEYPAVAANPEAGLDLVYAEFLLRQALGEDPAPDEFLGRFPQWAEQFRLQVGLGEALGAATRIGPLTQQAPSVEPGPAATRLDVPPGPVVGGWPAVPGYEVQGELGRGAMGVVYLARQLRADRLVALKMILSGAQASADELRRFQTEAEALGRLHHSGIVLVHEVGEHDGHPFFAMEFCPDGGLDKKLGTPMPPRDAAELVRSLSRALQAAHEAKVIHRDLKPGNVLLAPLAPGERGVVGEGEFVPKITDFGLAKKLDEVGQTQTGAIMGTPSYMAPEQATGRSDVGPLADVWALGASSTSAWPDRRPSRPPPSSTRCVWWSTRSRRRRPGSTRTCRATWR
jgi:hypothetical protein